MLGRAGISDATIEKDIAHLRVEDPHLDTQLRHLLPAVQLVLNLFGLKRPKHEMWDTGYFYKNQTRMVRWLGNRGKNWKISYVCVLFWSFSLRSVCSAFANNTKLRIPARIIKKIYIFRQSLSLLTIQVWYVLKKTLSTWSCLGPFKDICLLKNLQINWPLLHLTVCFTDHIMWLKLR